MLSKMSMGAALAAMLVLASGVTDAGADEGGGLRRAPVYRSTKRFYGPEFERPYWWYLGYRPYRGVVPFGVEPPYAARRVDVSCWRWRPTLFGGWRKDWVCGLW
jgi:hypothetical protein